MTVKTPAVPDKRRKAVPLPKRLPPAVKEKGRDGVNTTVPPHIGPARFGPLKVPLSTSYSTLLISAALAFSAGMFMCIALSDLLPELQFHQHDRLKLSVALLLGLALAWGISRLEAKSHDHSEQAARVIDSHEHDT